MQWGPPTPPARVMTVDCRAVGLKSVRTFTNWNHQLEVWNRRTIASGARLQEKDCLNVNRYPWRLGILEQKNVDRSRINRLSDKLPILHSPSTETGADGDPRSNAKVVDNTKDQSCPTICGVQLPANGSWGNVIQDLFLLL